MFVVLRLFFMFVVLPVLVMLAMSAFLDSCKLMNCLNIVCVRNISFHKFPPLGNALILMLVSRGCMLVTLFDPCRNVIGNQFYKRIG